MPPKPTSTLIRHLIASRGDLQPVYPPSQPKAEDAAEGGCGVIGMAASVPIAGRIMLTALRQMRNRGNGKGGGIAAAGLAPAFFGVSPQIMAEDNLLAVAYLDPAARSRVEEEAIAPAYEVDHVFTVPHLDDYRALGLETPPPEAVLYFVRPRPEALTRFAETKGLSDLPAEVVADEFVYQNSYRLNRAFYASIGDKQAFVLSHGKDLLVLKMVGYGDDVVPYYRLEDLTAHVWIGHHRYPTKGRVWHPGGAHPFVGLNEALVHNGDFANYASIVEYLAQRNIHPLFLTDTEVSVLVFDLLHRTYGYPLEYVIEALAPTTEWDFAALPPEKQRLYRMIQATHIHGSPDGPWFFLIAQSVREEGQRRYRLIGITDTSMLRPQVFAVQQGHDGAVIGFAASEKQGIDAALESLAAEDKRFWPRADRYWNARGGSHTDGGAFLFTVTPRGPHGTPAAFTVTDKFGRPVELGDVHREPYRCHEATFSTNGGGPVPTNADWFRERLPHWDYTDLSRHLVRLLHQPQEDAERLAVLETLTGLLDLPGDTGQMRRSSVRALVEKALEEWFHTLKEQPTPRFRTFGYGADPEGPDTPEQIAVVDARGFPPEGPDSLALFLVALYQAGFRRFIIAHARGQRFIGNGFGPNTEGVRMDVYGSPGDYLGSGMDGMHIYVHNNGQDQVAQITKRGKLVIYGDVGQTFGYAAKGGEMYILGNAAGRPLINAVGRPRVVINGTVLDYLAESFMAGDPLDGGGFVILNGLTLDAAGQWVPLETPYPGGNLFSLASGGAIYLRDPHHRVQEGQLNGGEFAELSEADWETIRPYLEENARLFGLSLERLLTVDGERRAPHEVYRKVQPARVRELQAEEAWVRGKG